jgi:transposase
LGGAMTPSSAPAYPNHINRRVFIGGSDARIIMGDDEAALVRLWREKRGEAEPPDYSANLLVQLGVATEPLNRGWYERTTGEVIQDVQGWIRHPVIRWMAATLDGIVKGTGAVFESKFMLPWSFSEEAAAEKHMAKKIKGRKRHAVTDKQGFLLALLVHAANIQDNHGAVPLLARLRAKFPKLRHIADRVYRGNKLRKALEEFGRWVIEIVTRSERIRTFKPEPKRWVIERTFAWLGRNRRLAKDFERSIASAEAWFMIASIRLLTCRLARG